MYPMRKTASAALAAGLLTLTLVFLFAPSPAHAEENDAFGERVREYLMQNPAIVVDILENAQSFYEQQAVEYQKSILRQNNAALIRDDDGGFVFGNPAGDLTLVEFFDYQCPYCKGVFRDLIRAVEDDGNVRLILREFPVFGDVSSFAARAALAAERQRLYFEFHAALMATDGKLTEARVFLIAESIGLDTTRLRVDMEEFSFAEALQANLDLARTVGIRGTPGFVSGTWMVSEALTYEEFRNLFTNLRNAQESSPSSGELGAP